MKAIKIIKTIFRNILDRVQNRGNNSLNKAHKDLELLKKIHGRRFPRWSQIRHVNFLLNSWEKVILRVSLWILIIGLGWTSLIIISHYRLQVPTYGGKYIEAVVGSPQLVNPIYSSVNEVDADLVRLVYSGLMRVDKNLNVVPDLAESYEVSADKKTYTFHLRKDALWHDYDVAKQNVTSKDVLFTVETIQNPLANSPLGVSFAGVQVSAPDDYTVKFTLAEPFAPFLSSLATVGILPEHIWSEVQSERMSLFKRNLQPIGSGPFVFKQLTKDDSGNVYNFDLVRFEKFYRPKAYLSEVEFDFFGGYTGPDGSDGEAIQALKEQKVLGIHFVPTSLRDRVERKHIILHTLQLPQYTALFFNQNNSVALKNKSLREALETSIDKENLLKETIQKEGSVIAGPILAGAPGYDSNISLSIYSVDDANKLLDKDWTKITREEYLQVRREELIREWEKGEKTAASSSSTTSTGRDQILQEIDKNLSQEMATAQTYYRKAKDGTILQLNLVTADTPEYKKAAEIIAGYWQEIGIKTAVEYVPVKDMARSALKDRNYDVLLYGFILGADPDQFAFWHSSQVAYPGLNLAQYVNKDVDALLSQAREETDEVKVADLYKKIQDKISSDRPAIFLYSPAYTYATLDQVKGIDLSRISTPSDRFADIAEWYLKTKGQWKW